MKKAFILALFLVPSIAFASFDVDLHYGSKGDDVVALQEYLTDQGVYTGPITGNFYSLTLRAVRKYQKNSGITPISGYVGPITRGVINAELADAAPDSEGNAVVIAPTPEVTPTPVSIPAPVVQPTISQPVAASAPDVSRITLSIGGVEGTVTTKYNGCIQNFTKTCSTAELQWSAPSATDCGFTASPYMGWAGNYGTSGSKQATFTGTTTVQMTCNTPTGATTTILKVVPQYDYE